LRDGGFFFNGKGPFVILGEQSKFYGILSATFEWAISQELSEDYLNEDYFLNDGNSSGFRGAVGDRFTFLQINKTSLRKERNF